MADPKTALGLSEEDKRSYLLSLLAVIAADGAFSSDEVIRVYSLFSLLGVESSTRIDLLDCLIKNRISSHESLLPKSLLEDGEARTSLAKDMMFLESKAKDNRTLNQIRSYLQQLKLTAEQADVIRGFVVVENQILDHLGAGEEWKADQDSWKELASRAASVGVPLTALNMAGIAGFSAVGITSGLAALGSMSGLTLLGLNPMTAGIGALILGGVAVKKIADYALSGDSSESSQLRLFRESRLSARQAIAADLASISRHPKRELLLFWRGRRRRALVAGMTTASAVLSAT